MTEPSVNQPGTECRMSDNDLQAVEKLHEAYRQITRELDKVIVGQREVIEQLLIAMFARGHCLLVGVPGLAKTLLISTLARALDLKFSRIQFTPDLLPADVIGTMIYNIKVNDFSIKKGDILLVIGNAESYRIVLVNPESMSTYLDLMSKQIDKMKSTIKKK